MVLNWLFSTCTARTRTQKRNALAGLGGVTGSFRPGSFSPEKCTQTAACITDAAVCAQSAAASAQRRQLAEEQSAHVDHQDCGLLLARFACKSCSIFRSCQCRGCCYTSGVHRIASTPPGDPESGAPCSTLLLVRVMSNCIRVDYSSDAYCVARKPTPKHPGGTQFRGLKLRPLNYTHP